MDPIQVTFTYSLNEDHDDECECGRILIEELDFCISNTEFSHHAKYSYINGSCLQVAKWDALLNAIKCDTFNIFTLDDANGRSSIAVQNGRVYFNVCNAGSGECACQSAFSVKSNYCVTAFEQARDLVRIVCGSK
jgi:hypothetical protein